MPPSGVAVLVRLPRRYFQGTDKALVLCVVWFVRLSSLFAWSLSPPITDFSGAAGLFHNFTIS